MHITVKQGIDNCYLVHQYEHPGYEEDGCAGLRTGNGEGEPIDKCKESDGTLNNTAVTGNYEDLVLIEGDNKVTITDGFDLKVIPYWRYL